MKQTFYLQQYTNGDVILFDREEKGERKAWKALGTVELDVQPIQKEVEKVMGNLVCAFALLGVMRTETSGSRLQMTNAEVSQVMGNLKKRSAADCILTRTETGFQCREMATGKSYKVRVK